MIKFGPHCELLSLLQIKIKTWCGVLQYPDESAELTSLSSGDGGADQWL